MKSRITIISLIALIVVAGAFASTTKTTTSHGKSVHGTVASLNDSAKTFAVKTAAKKTYDLTWNDATKVSGGTLKDGESVTARYMVKDGKNVATSIMIITPKKKG